MACTSLLPTDPRATCAASMDYTNRTLYKQYSCKAAGSISMFVHSVEVRKEMHGS